MAEEKMSENVWWEGVFGDWEADRWMAAAAEAIEILPKFPLVDHDHESSRFWLRSISGIFPVFRNLLRLVGKHGGSVFGGFVRDFFRPLCLLRVSTDHLRTQLDHNFDVWCILLDYLFLPESLHFKDVDIWFRNKTQYLAFIQELTAQHVLRPKDTPLSNFYKTVPPSPHDMVGHLKDLKLPDIHCDYPILRDSWSIWPFYSNEVGLCPAKERNQQLATQHLQIDCVVCEHLPVNNFAINLLYFTPSDGSWHVGHPFTFSPNSFSPVIRNNASLQVEFHRILEHVDYKTTTILPDYATLITSNLMDKHRFEKLQLQIRQFEDLPTPRDLGLEDRRWYNAVRNKLERLADLNITILQPPPPFRYFPPTKRRRSQISK